ncbi:hypothetical protein JB92DRAFT_2833715 [Gautieria morchelliformis]|nr:hypothetical protein JB92DRAFT_2833715 [Gautieria morchelliformis]
MVIFSVRDLWDRYHAVPKEAMTQKKAMTKEEHREIKNLVYEADTTSSAKDDYDEILSRAVNAFDKHAAEEEKGILVEMEKTLSAETSDFEARKFLAARETAPPRPHPTAPQTGGTLQEAAAAQAKVPDRLVNFMRRVDYVDLKVFRLGMTWCKTRTTDTKRYTKHTFNQTCPRHMQVSSLTSQVHTKVSNTSLR